MKSVVLIAIGLALGSVALAAAPPPAKRAAPARKVAPADWSKVARVTPSGTIMVGNPAAKVKIVEYLSFTCPHCAAFSRDSAATLKGELIRRGSTSLEYRPLTSNQLDLAAAIVARCSGPARYAAIADAIFARQSDWVPRGADFINRELPRYAAEKPIEQVRLTAQSSGLIDLAKAQGVSAAQIKACFADRTIVVPILKTGDDAIKIIQFTPTFYVGGRDTEVHDWASLEPLLRAEGAQ